MSGEIPHSQLSHLKSLTLINIVLCRGWHTQVNDRFQNYKIFNCSLEFNLTHLLTIWVMSSSYVFWRRWIFFFFFFFFFCIGGLTISMLRVPPNMLRENIECLPPWIFLVVVLFTLWLFCVFSLHRSDIYRSSQNHLKTEGRICFKSKSCIGERGHHLGCYQ